MQETMRLEKYFPASEITVLAVCFVMVILLVVSFKVRMKSFRMFAAMLWMLIVATCSDLMLHYLMNKDPTLPTWIFYSLRSIYHVLLFSLLHHYALYTCEATALSRVKRRPYIAAATALFAVFSVADTVGIFTGRTMHIIDGVISFEGSHIFTAPVQTGDAGICLRDGTFDRDARRGPAPDPVFLYRGDLPLPLDRGDVPASFQSV